MCIMFSLVRTAPPRNVREMYAQGIVELFPYLMDPYSKNGYVSLLMCLQTVKVHIVSLIA